MSAKSSTAVEIHQPQSRAVVDAQTASEIKAQVNRIQEVMKAVMKPETHFGKIPGTPKPTLYKAGSEVLLSTFRIAVEPEVEDLSTPDQIRYRVTARGVHMASGVTVGAGIGEASSSEEKYKWRKAVCDEEFDETDESRRRTKYAQKWGQQRGQRTVERTKQVRTEPADVANTVLKMAKKRAQVDLTLTALAASDIFTQDIEDLPEHMREVAEDVPPPETISMDQIAALEDLLKETGADRSAFLKWCKAESIEDLPAAKFARALKTLEDKRTERVPGEDDA